MLKVDHDLNSNNAAGFRKSSNLAARMMRRAEGELVEEPIKKISNLRVTLIMCNPLQQHLLTRIL